MPSYDTLSEALTALKSRGYTLDFNLSENCLICAGKPYSVEEFEITEVYRFEGQTDPADEAILYAIESADGIKGVLVSGYGVSAEGMSAEMAKKLRFHH
jgi:hypothetical protein